MGYKYFQPNKKDLKDKAGDCVVRALAKATGRDWLDVYDDLVNIGRQMQRMPNDNLVYGEYLTGYHFVRKALKKGRKPTLEQFAREHKKGTYVAHLTTHAVTIIDGTYYDTCDCGEWCVFSYYEKEVG